jgi:hypothetical protein
MKEIIGRGGLKKWAKFVQRIGDDRIEHLVEEYFRE